MQSSSQNITEGRIHKINGKIKEVIGYLFGNRKVEAEGKDENLEGRVQEKIGKVEKVAGE